MGARRAWYVALEASGTFSEDVADDLVEALAKLHASASYGNGRVGVSLSLEATSPLEAAEKGTKVFLGALKRPARLEAVEVKAVEDLDKELERPNYPRLVGVAEVASLLGVSRQRVSELARADYFPAPLAQLAAGPVWDRVSLTHFLETWERTPRRKRGRPKKSVALPGRESHAYRVAAKSS